MNIKQQFKMTKKEKVVCLVLLGIIVLYGVYQTAFGYTVGSNGTVTIHGANGKWATFFGQPGSDTSNTTAANSKFQQIENTTWYMINSTGSLSKITFGNVNEKTGLTPFTRLLNGHMRHGVASYPEVEMATYVRTAIAHAVI